MIPVALASSVWWMARQLLRVLAGLAMTALALAMVVRGAAAASAVPPAPEPVRPAVVAVAPLTDHESASPTVRSDRPDAPADADHLIVVDGTGPALESPHQPSGAGRVTSPVHEPAAEPLAGRLAQRAPPRA